MKKILLQNIYVRLATSALLLLTILPAVSKGQCPVPTISTNWISSATIVRLCEGEAADFTANTADPDPGISYLWSNGETTQSITVGVSGDLYVTTTDQNGCSATSEYWYVYVEPTPEIGGIYSVPPDCSGNNGLIAIFATEPGNTSGYTIDGFATTSSGSDFSGLGPGTYLIGIQSFRGCRSELTSITLDAPEYSEVQIVCQPDLEVNADQGANSADVVVDPPSASGGCGELSIASSHPGSSFPVGTTIITWTASDPYGGTATCQQSVTVLGQTAPELTCPPDIIVQPTSLSGSVVNFPQPANATQTAGPASGTVFPIGETKVTFEASNASGTATCSFIVKVLDPFCSGSGKNKKVYVCHKGQTLCISVNALQAHLGHGDKLGECSNAYSKPAANKAAPAMSIFPNPTKGQFTVQLNNIPALDGSLLILDAKGSVIESRSVKKATFSPTISLNLSNKAKGMYIVRFVSNADVYTTKVIVE